MKIKPGWESGWGLDPMSAYLGSERSPQGRWYDYWLIRTADYSSPISLRYSAVARHGDESHEYSIQKLIQGYLDHSHLPLRKDLTFGCYRAMQLALYFLATGEKPLADIELQPWDDNGPRNKKEEPTNG